MKQVELDSIDRQIIAELLADARIPIATLGKRVGLSRHAVQHRIDRLESARVIAGYTIRLEETGAHANSVMAFMMVYRKDRMRGRDVVAAIKQHPEVKFCYVLSGTFDLIVYLEAPSQARIMEIWSSLSRLSGVTDTTTAFVLSTIVRNI